MAISPFTSKDLVARLHAQVRNLISTSPDPFQEDDEDELWLGRVYAVVNQVDGVDAVNLKIAEDDVWFSATREAALRKFRSALHRALAVLEVQLPAQAQGAFVAAESPFDAMSSVGRVFAGARSEVLIVDPYMDHQLATDFLPMVPEGIQIRLLADEAAVKPSFAPSIVRWKAQFSTTRPIEARLAPARRLHDRLIVVDAREVWLLTQSFNALAARSPATIQRVDADPAALKLRAFEDVWLVSAAI